MLETFKFFLILGATGFGGPLSLVQLMREEYVDRKKWLTQQEFDQVFTLIKAMPGPVAFQMAVFLGRRFYQIAGATLAGIGLILPSFLMIVSIGYFYENLAHLAYIKFAMNGFLYSVSAIILLSLKSMVITNYKSFAFWIIIFLSFCINWQGLVAEPIVIIGFGGLVVALKSKFLKNTNSVFSAAIILIDWEKIIQLFKTCLYAGAFVFGTGLAILPVLKSQFVDQFHWLVLQEFNDGVIFGQMTPGPVTITASFLGFRIAGFLGALVATFAIFLMPFIHMVTWFPSAVRWLSVQTWIKSFLLGATGAVIGSILVTVVRMNIDTYKSILFWLIFISTTAILIYRPKTSLLLIILVSGIFNLLVSLAATNPI